MGSLPLLGFERELRELKAAAAELAGLAEGDLKALGLALGRLEPPINRGKIKAVGERLGKDVGRLGDHEWEGIAALVLQLLSVPDFVGLIEDSEAVDAQGLGRIRRAVDLLRAEPLVRTVIAADRLLDRGPRLKHVSWSCDIRTQLPGAGGEEGDTLAPAEEIRLPIVIVRMKIDEVDAPVYFQMTASELEGHISVLRDAHKQLRQLMEMERG